MTIFGPPQPPNHYVAYYDSNVRSHARPPIYPLGHGNRKRPRRWPLVLRFSKGAVHRIIIVPVISHALFTIAVVCLHVYGNFQIGIPTSIISSLSIVVGLMLVFRNQTSYDRFWSGRNNFTNVITATRNLMRSFLCCSYKEGSDLTKAEKIDVERTARILMAIPYAVKNHLRAEWSSAWAPALPESRLGYDTSDLVDPTINKEFSDLLPNDVYGHEPEGLGLPIQLAFSLESFIKRGVDRGWFNGPQSSQLTVQINNLVDAYGKMETIYLTPFPIAILVHQRQVLALFCAVLPFCMVNEMGWWSVPIVVLVIFTLYGIEGIGRQLEDPFGYDRNCIKMDAILEDSRAELDIMLKEWEKAHSSQPPRKELFLGGDRQGNGQPAV